MCTVSVDKSIANGSVKPAETSASFTTFIVFIGTISDENETNNG